MMPTVSGSTSAGYLVNILIGNNGSVQVTYDDPPQVQSFTFAKSPFNLKYRRGGKTDANNSATAVRFGSSYKITGTANGDEGQNQVVKSFEVDVTCP